MVGSAGCPAALRLAGGPAVSAGCGQTRTGTTAPKGVKKKNTKRGVRSQARREARIHRGQERRQESQGPRDPVGTGPQQQTSSTASVVGERIRLKSASRPPLPRRRRQVVQRSSAPSGARLKLKSVEPRRQRANLARLRLGQAVQEAKENQGYFKKLRFRERVAWRRQWVAKLPRGTVGNQFNRLLPPNCSSCDERARIQRPELEKYAAKRFPQPNREKITAATREVAYGQRPSKLVSKLRAESEALRVSRLLVKKRKAPEEESSESETTEQDPGEDPGSGPDYGGGSAADGPGSSGLVAAPVHAH